MITTPYRTHQRVQALVGDGPADNRRYTWKYGNIEHVGARIHVTLDGEKIAVSFAPADVRTV